MEIDVAISSPLYKTFKYSYPEPIEPGTRVKVPFSFQGHRVGVVLSYAPEDLVASAERTYQLKPIQGVIDSTPILSKALLKLGNWLSDYYMHPIGEVFQTMLPVSKTKHEKVTYTLVNRESVTHDGVDLNAIFGKKPRLTESTLNKKLLMVTESKPKLKKLIQRWIRVGIISVVKDKDERVLDGSKKRQVDDLEPANSKSPTIRPKLSEEQTRAVQSLTVDLKSIFQGENQKPTLLHGVTGSGKTEVFLTVLEELLTTTDTAQALVMVPEISLTPQMTDIFRKRFPGQIAVVHSAMEDHKRWTELDSIRQGKTRVLIGPRSAVFGPFRDLKLIVVDEEHDSSYKQGSGLLYNGRDVAVVRGKIERSLVILASATPSMESWLNAETGKYKLLSLPNRISLRPLPKVEHVQALSVFKSMSVIRQRSNLSTDQAGASDESQLTLAPEIVERLKDNLTAGHQSILLVNRRGFAHYLYDATEGKPVECPQCSISLTVHGKRQILRCHYCEYRSDVQSAIAKKPSHTWTIVGHGSQRAEDALKTLLPEARVQRVDSDVVANPEALPKILDDFRSGQIDILVGTQILAKGHDFPNVTLICILEIDQLLGMPDFRGGERTFQLLVQASGRAGRGQHEGKVILQTLRGQHPIIQYALRHDFIKFAESEMNFRRALGYPPFGKMIAFEISATKEGELNTFCSDVEAKLDSFFEGRQDLLKEVRVLGPVAAPIEVIRGRFRRSILVTSGRLDVTRTVGAWIWDLIKAPASADLRTKVDVDPLSTM